MRVLIEADTLPVLVDISMIIYFHPLSIIFTAGIIRARPGHYVATVLGGGVFCWNVKPISHAIRVGKKDTR